MADIEEAQSSQKIDPFTVPIDVADEVASAFSISSETLSRDAKNLRKSGERKTKKSTETITDESGTPLYHIINFKEGGFVVVSADYRAIPIIAFNDTGELNYERDKDVNGLSLWFMESKEQIKDIKNGEKEVERTIEKAWKEYLKDGFVFPTNRKGRPSDTNCYEWYQYGQFMCQNSIPISHGPLLSSHWGQYNVTASLISISTKNCDGCGNFLAGCGPVAIGQVAKYLRRFDTSPYNYSIMPDFTQSYPAGNRIMPCKGWTSNGYNHTPEEFEIAELIRDIGYGANAQYDYFGTCNTLMWRHDIKTGITVSGLNGNNVIDEDFMSNRVNLKNEVAAGYPVILVGYDPADAGILYRWHIWVCDGYREQVYSEFNCNTLSCDTYGVQYFHMKWGFGEGYDGYYGLSGFNPRSNRNYIAGLRTYRNIRK